jgi:hypothetical protein
MEFQKRDDSDSFRIDVPKYGVSPENRRIGAGTILKTTTRDSWIGVRRANSYITGACFYGGDGDGEVRFVEPNAFGVSNRITM